MNNNKVQEIDEIVNYVLQKKYGENITYQELQQFTNYDLNDEYESYKFKASIMGRVKNILIEYGYILKAVKYMGYYILKPNQVQSYTYRTYIVKPLRHLKKAEIILINTKTKTLKENELINHRLTIELDKDLISATDNLVNSKKYETLNPVERKKYNAK